MTIRPATIDDVPAVLPMVQEDYRNEGIGRQLVTAAVERFRALGAEQVRCDTVWDNATARDLFRACGFRPSVVEMLMEIRKT